jgi:hypothetical protein
MAYTTSEGREELLGVLAEAIGMLGAALESLSSAYGQLDDLAGERLEEGLFSSVQRAYGLSMRTYAAFAGRRPDVGGTGPEAPAAAAPSRDTRELITAASEAASRADSALAALQDKPVLIEIGDAELRAGLASTREAVSGVPGQAREFLRTLGR